MNGDSLRSLETFWAPKIPPEPIGTEEWDSLVFSITQRVTPILILKKRPRRAPRVLQATIRYLLGHIYGTPWTQSEVAAEYGCVDASVRESYIDVYAALRELPEWSILPLEVPCTYLYRQTRRGHV